MKNIEPCFLKQRVTAANDSGKVCILIAVLAFNTNFILRILCRESFIPDHVKFPAENCNFTDDNIDFIADNQLSCRMSSLEDI